MKSQAMNQGNFSSKTTGRGVKQVVTVHALVKSTGGQAIYHEPVASYWPVTGEITFHRAPNKAELAFVNAIANLK